MTGWNSQFYLFEGLGNNSPVRARIRQHGSGRPGA